MGLDYVIRAPRPPEIEAWLERRRLAGLDRFDEAWEGRYVEAPDPHGNHSRLQLAIAALLLAAARRFGLHAMATFNLGAPGDYRVPDAGLTAVAPAIWHETAVLVVEIPAPDDATLDKLDFYRAPAVRVLLILDWATRSVRVLDVQADKSERPGSAILGMTIDEITEAIDWPPLDD